MCGKPHIAFAESNKIIVYSAKLYYNLIKSPKPDISYTVYNKLSREILFQINGMILQAS